MCPNPLKKGDLISEYQASVEDKIKRYRSTGHNNDFWREQEKRLSGFTINYKINENNICERSPSYKNADYWLPTSEELRNLLGLKFKGSLCSDDINCYRKKPLMFFCPNVTFHINGKVYQT